MPEIPDSTIEDKRRLELRYIMPKGGVAKFFDGLREGKIEATRCNRCNTLYFPPQPSCSKCNESDVSWVQLSGEATLETFTKIVVKPTSFSGNGDYIVAIGRMREGVNVLATLNVKDERDVKVGMKLKLVTVEKEGSVSYEFIPWGEEMGK